VVPDTIPDAVFEITGRTESGIVMGMRHRELPLEGVQFHPESVLTEGGHRMLANWLATAGHPVDPVRVNELERATKALQKAAVA
jgi:para-aminobenzoate synthetase component 2